MSSKSSSEQKNGQTRRFGLSRWPKWLRWTCLVLVAALLSGTTYYAVKARQATAAAPTESTLQTATPRTGNLVLQASGTGYLVASTEANIAFEIDGKIAEVDVALGDKVEKDQVLARLDDAALQYKLEEAQLALLELTSPEAIANAELAVSKDQAKELLPLWETLQSMASSATAASQEVEAVVSQIESRMSSEQISSITAMNLTQQDLQTVAMDSGTSLTAASTTSSSNTSSLQSQAGAGAPGGGNPPADMGGAMPSSSGSQPVNQVQTGTTQTVSSQASGTTNQATTALINTLVELLQKKVA